VDWGAFAPLPGAQKQLRQSTCAADPRPEATNTKQPAPAEAIHQALKVENAISQQTARANARLLTLAPSHLQHVGPKKMPRQANNNIPSSAAFLAARISMIKVGQSMLYTSDCAPQRPT
jgi:small-conductance mechanosensitive channel